MERQLTIIGFPLVNCGFHAPLFHPMSSKFLASGFCHARSFVCLSKALEAGKEHRDAQRPGLLFRARASTPRRPRRNTTRRSSRRHGQRASTSGTKCAPSQRPTPPPRSTSMCRKPQYFDQKTCWRGRGDATATCPGPPRRRRRRCCFKRLRFGWATELGAVLTVGMDWLHRTGWAGYSATAPGYGPTGTTTAGSWESCYWPTCANS